MRRTMRAFMGIGLACAAALCLAGGMAAAPALGKSPVELAIAVPKPGVAGTVAAPPLNDAPLGGAGTDPKRIEAALNALPKPDAPNVVASIGGSHSAELYRKLAPLVVLVVTDDGLGSGSLVSADGTVLTNNHVILGFDQATVILKPVKEGAAPTDEDAFTADVVKVDQVADLALLKIRDWPGWLYVELGDADAVSVGDDVHAIGHPKGETWTYTKGVISAMRNGYSWVYGGEFKHQADVIQTQTPINPGNSGGPLFDDEGRLIGVNSFGEGDAQGLNFAVSVREVRRFLETSDNRYAEAADSQDETEECAPAVLFEGRNDADTADIRQTDYDCDDYAEVVELWFDDPSIGYVVELDLDRDGRWEKAVVDSNSDGKWDYSLYDTDADGVVDLRGLHPDGAWEASTYEQV